jgi:nucleoside-diphosphate-sugar epimerase
MLEHLHLCPVPPGRVAILGAGGFIGGAIHRRLLHAGVKCLPLGRPGFDLLAADAGDRLAALLDPADTLVFVSAHAPVKTAPMLLDNLRMAAAVGGALQKRPVRHVVYVSSDAVYRDSDQPLSEASCAEPASLHGTMHAARETMLRAAYAGPFAIVRPTLVYGVDDPHNGYGPNRFRRLAAAGQPITLFGEGEERRDHVAVEDIAELVCRIVHHCSRGVVNAVSGEVASFRELAEFCADQFAPRVPVTGSPRSGPMPHGGYRPFAPSAALQVFPGFTFRPWRAGLAANCAATPRP